MCKEARMTKIEKEVVKKALQAYSQTAPNSAEKTVAKAVLVTWEEVVSKPSGTVTI